MQSTLRPPEVHIRAIHLMSTRGLYGAYVYVGVNDMHTMHVVLKIVHVYVWL